MCVFLSERSTLFVVSGFAAQCRGPAFFCLWEGRRRRRGADDGPAAARAKSLRAEQRGRSDTQRCAKKGRKMFSRGGKIGGRLPILWVEAEIGPQLLRPWDIGTAAKTSRAWVAAQGEARGGKTQLVAACGLRSSLSSLYTLDTYA